MGSLLLQQPAVAGFRLIWERCSTLRTSVSLDAPTVMLLGGTPKTATSPFMSATETWAPCRGPILRPCRFFPASALTANCLRALGSKARPSTAVMAWIRWTISMRRRPLTGVLRPICRTFPRRRFSPSATGMEALGRAVPAISCRTLRIWELPRPMTASPAVPATTGCGATVAMTSLMGAQVMTSFPPAPGRTPYGAALAMTRSWWSAAPDSMAATLWFVRMRTPTLS